MLCLVLDTSYDKDIKGAHNFQQKHSCLKLLELLREEWRREKGRCTTKGKVGGGEVGGGEVGGEKKI